MSTAATPVAPKPRRRFVPQFSLRALLVVVTVSAIGMAVWYHMPIEEEVEYPVTPQLLASLPQNDWMPKREVRTVRRGFGKDRVQHGWTRVYDFAGRLYRETLWQESQQSGPTREWHKGVLRHEGMYLNDRKDGVWKMYAGTPSQVTSIQSWKRGLPHGFWEIYDAKGVGSRKIECWEGAVKQIDGRAVGDPLMARARAGKIDDQRIQREIQYGAMLDFTNVAVKDVVVYLQEAHGIPIEVDVRSLERQRISITKPITENLDRIPLSIALVAMLEPVGVAADYRFGVIMICSAEDAKTWRDRTGVEKILPRPDSALARQWEEDVTIDCVEAALPAVIAQITNQTGIPFDLSPLALGDATQPRRRTSITMNLNGPALKNALGILCEQCELHVRQHGDTLVLEPMEQAKE